MTAVNDNRTLRHRVLDALYRERKARPLGQGLFIGELETQFGTPLDFDVQYLVEKGLVSENADYLKLTVAGIDAVEEETYGR